MFKSDTPKERLSSYGTLNTPPAGSRHGLGNIGGNRQDREEGTPAMHQTDSAYGSSDNTGHGIVQVENDGTIPNTNKSQNLALDKGTGEVFDEDTGQVVTVVTTTTTTTTTTTVRGNERQQDVHKDVHTTSTQKPQGSGAPHSYDDPAAAAQYTVQQPGESTYSSGLVPEIPARSARRSGEYTVSPNFSGEAPTSPSSKHNFSYPGRNAPAGAGLTHEEESSSRRSGRFADLKAAAIGLHGVGETLRGTLNKELDSRYPSKKPEKAALINAKNAAVLERGRNEMGSLHHNDSHYSDKQPISPISDHDAGYNRHSLNQSAYGQNNTHAPDNNPNTTGTAEPGSHSAVFGLTPSGQQHLDTSPSRTPVPQIAQDGSSVSNLTTSSGGDAYQPPRGTAVRANSSMAPETVSGNVEKVPVQPQQSLHPNNDNLATSGGGEGGIKKQGTFSKLFKRKPVAGDTATEGDKKKYY